MTEKLPESTGTMKIAEAITLEVFHMLIESGVITEKVAIKRYDKLKAKYPSWRRN